MIKLIRLPLVFTLLVGLKYSAVAQLNSVDIILSPDYTFRSLDQSPERDDYERFQINPRLGVNLDFDLLRSLKLSMGIRWAKYSYKTSDDDLRWPSETTEDGYLNDPISPFAGTGSHSYNFVEIPINLRYYVETGRVSYFVEAGMSTNFSTIDKWGNQYEVNQLNFNTNLGLGVEYDVSDHWQLMLKPIFRYHLTPTLNAYINEYL